MPKETILTVGLAHSHGGFSRVVHSLVEKLYECYDIHHLAVNLSSPPAPRYPFHVHANDVDGDWLGETKLYEMVQSLRPRLVWMLNDFWFLAKYHRLLRDLRGRLPTVAYVPLDGRILRHEQLWPLGLFDTVVLYNRFSRDELASALRRVSVHRPGFEPPRLEVVPHGVDAARFHRLDLPEATRRARARRALFGHDEHAGAFWVLNANQNATRKRLDLTLEGFARFARGKPADVKLYLHSATRAAAHRGYDVPALAERLGIRHRLLFTREDGDPPAISDSRMNLIYNACDVGLNTSYGEGWGLVSFEHAATGAAQIVPCHTACRELWRGAAELLPTTASVPRLGAPLEARNTTAEAVAAALERLYADPEHRYRMARAARANATRPEYQWSHIGRRWQRLFQRRIEARDPPDRIEAAPATHHPRDLSQIGERHPNPLA
ncbi:MAG: glycosyltransferase [Holophagales bacterium]|nr:glycosyltransferase [Holophagales bacterium]